MARRRQRAARVTVGRVSRSAAWRTVALAGLVAGGVAAGGSTPAAGQAPTRPTVAELRALFGMPVPAIGLRGGYDFVVDSWSIGAQALIPAGPERRILFMPSGDLFLRRHRADWQLNADVAAGLGPLRLYHVGAGLALLNREAVPGAGAETRAGLNLFAGLEFPGVRTATRPYLQLRWTTGDDAPLHLLIGFNFRLTDP